MTTEATSVGLDAATIAHEVPGRVRLKIASLRRNPVRAAELERLASEVDPVEYVRTNTRTGSIVIEYDPAFASPTEVLERLSRILHFEIRPGQGREASNGVAVDATETVEWVRSAAREMNARVARRAGGVDLRVLVPGALFCLGVGALLGARRRRMPAWHDLIWYAFNTFQMLNPPADNTVTESSGVRPEDVTRP